MRSADRRRAAAAVAEADRPEGVHECHGRGQGRRFAAKLNVRPGFGLRKEQAVRTAQEASVVVRHANLRALLGGAQDRLDNDALRFAVFRLAASPGCSGRKALEGARKAVGAALKITVDKRSGAHVFGKKLPMSWGDVWASATGVPEFGAAVETQAVDQETRNVRSGVVVRVENAVGVGLWNSPAGKTLGSRCMVFRVAPVGAAEANSDFLTAAVAREWALKRVCRRAERLAEFLQDHGSSKADFAAMLGCNPLSKEDEITAGHDATTELFWQMYSKARDDAAAAAVVAQGRVNFAKAPCLGNLIDGSAPESRHLKHDLRFDLAVVLEELARRLGGHARTMFPLETLGALCTFAKPESKKSFEGTLHSIARKTPGPRSKCVVLAARTARGASGLKCPASSIDACHRAAGIPLTVPPEDVTPGMVASCRAPDPP